jgi:Flp pilus assembly protein TadD
MVRAVAMSAASALCLIWAAGCADMSESAAKTASTSQADKTAGAEMAMNADPAMMRANMPTTLEGEIQRAQELRSKGNYDEAGRSFAQLLLVAPDDARVVGGYGKVLEQQGHSQQALAFLKHAVELNPNDWSLQSALGIAYDQNDDHKSARGAYDRALALKPGEGSVLNNYAVSRMLAGDYASAKRMFAEAQSRGVSNPKIALNLDKLASLNEVPAASVAVPAKPMIDAKSAAASETTVQTGPVTVANLGAPAAQSTVHASPAKPASNSAMTAPVPPAAKTPSGRRVAIAGPKPLAPTVVMQKVPVDPLAGPTKHREHSVQKLASTSHQPAKPVVPKATAAAAPAAPPPALRTAADGD